MVKTAFLAGLAGLLLAVAVPASAAPSRKADAPELSAQERRQSRLRVTPGRLLYRDCEFKLVQQYRPSGTVIVPWQRCWWVRG